MTPLAALQAALSVQHQVVYGYGVVGARLPTRSGAGQSAGVTRERCLARLDEHRLLRDTLTTLARAAGAEPEPGDPAYALPFRVHDPRTAARLGVLLEDAVAGAMWDVVASSQASSAARRTGVANLAAAARWSVTWQDAVLGGLPRPALPGQPASQPSTTATSSSSPSMTASGSTS